MKNAVIALLLIVILGGGYYMYSQGMLGAASEQQTTEKDTNLQNSGDSRITEPVISWTLEDIGERDYIPYTRVFVTVNGKLHSVGDFQGSCSEIGEAGGVDGKGLLAGELSAVQCWFAGGGDEIGVFAVEDGTLDLMVGKLEEPIEGAPGFRGDFEIRPEFRF